MLRLLTFGGLALENGDASATPRLRPPRLALLAVLAAAGERGCTRERLTGLFWPEASEEHGRHSLRQALYGLRSDIGRDVIVAGSSLALNPGFLTSDVAQFRAALEGGDHKRAVELYRGAFLDGFYLSGTAEFERWSELERERLAAAQSAALLALANEAAGAGSGDEAAHWWYRLSLHEPLSARVAVGYIQALSACGDRAKALAFIRSHEAAVRRELDADPDPEIRKLEIELRAMTDSPAGAPAGPPASVAMPAGPAPALEPPRDTPRPAVRQKRRTSRWVRVAAIGTPIAIVLALIGGAIWFRSAPAPGVAPPLYQAHTKSPVAARFYQEGVRAFYTWDFPAARNQLTAALREDSTFAMAAYVAVLAWTQPDAWARERALRLARQAPERERLMIMADLLEGDMDPSALPIAEEAAAKYPEDGRITHALAKVRQSAGDWPGAAAAYERALDLYLATGTNPEDCLACGTFGNLADVYFWWDSLPAVERVARRYLRAYPQDGWPWALLAGVGARMGDSGFAFSNLRRYLSLTPAGFPRGHELAVLLTLELYDRVEQEVQPLLASSRQEETDLGRWNLMIALRNQGRLTDAAELLRTGRIPGSAAPPSVPTTVDHVNEAIVAFETGYPRRAAAHFETLRRDAALNRTPGKVARAVTWNTTLKATALTAAGDTAQVRQLVDTVRFWGAQTLFGRDRKAHHVLQGLLLASAGRHAEAAEEFRASISSTTFGYTRVNYELARCLLHLGRATEAVAILQSALRGSIEAANLYITRTELHELLAQAFEQAGRPDSAAAHYQAVVRAWTRADAQFIPRREAAQRRLNQHLASH